MCASEPWAVFWYHKNIKYSHSHAKDGWSFSSCSPSGLVRQEGEGQSGFYTHGRCHNTGLPSPLLPLMWMPSYSSTGCLPALTDPVDATALLFWLVPEGERGRNPILGSGEVPHGAGTQWSTGGWTGQCCPQQSKGGHGASVTETETLSLPNDLVLVQRGGAAVGSAHNDGLSCWPRRGRESSRREGSGGIYGRACMPDGRWGCRRRSRRISGVPRDKNGHKLLHRKWNLDRRKIFFTMRVVKHLHGLSQEVVASVSSEALKTWQDPALSNLPWLILLWAGGRTRQPPGVPSSLNHAETL